MIRMLLAALLALLPGGTFTDDNGSVHEPDIEAIAAAAITKGCNPPANDHFCPDGAVSRGEMAAFLSRALDLPAGTTDFFDDDAGSVFEARYEMLATDTGWHIGGVYVRQAGVGA